MKSILSWLIMVFFIGSAYSQSLTQSENCNIHLGSRFMIDVAHDNKERQFPFAYKFGKVIFVSYSEHPDAVTDSSAGAIMISRNDGRTWKEKITNPDFGFTSMFKKNNLLYGIDYSTYPISSHQEKMTYWTSNDQGKIWTKHVGVVNAPLGKGFKTKGTWGSMLFHRGMQVMKDGSIQGPMYGAFQGDKKFSVVWVRSADNCATWNIVSVVASGVPENFPKTQGFCEPSFATVKDGSLLCVMRIDSYLPLFQSRSKDGGLTWSKPAELPGLDSSEAESVDPHLLLMNNGILVLSYGRPDTRIAISEDGSGYKWNKSLITYDGVTTGYTGIVEYEPGKLLQIADQGANWSKGVKEKAIWGRSISVLLKPHIN